MRYLMAFVTCTLTLLAADLALGQESYPVHVDSMAQEGVPQGKIDGPNAWKSDIFPGTQRNYWVYVPAQYDAAKPACLLVVQDGLGSARNWKLPTVMDNLIHKGEMPVTIGVFISPGMVPAAREGAKVRLNRSFEYDSLGDRYARFLLEEILPDVAKKYQISDDPNDRAIAGSSSGAICAFNVAWERPDKFRRVLSAVGTYVGLRGGHQFPVLVRKCEAKPIRVFLQDGSNDLNIFSGSWWVANQDMLSSLKWAGYDVMHAWGEGGHNGKQMTAILPDALRWLWRDYPKPIAIGQDGAKRRTEILIPGEDWQEVAAGYRFTEGPAVNDRGEIYFTDIPNSKIFKIGTDGAVSLFAENTDSANGLMMASDGKIYACANGAKQIVAYSVDGKRETIVANVESNDLVIVNHGIYFTDPRNKKVHYFRFDDKSTKVVDTGIEFPNGIVVSPDRSLLYVSDTRGQFVYSFQIQADGTLAYKQPYFHLHVPFGASSTGADGMTVDAEGRLYVTTQMGLQVCDEPGRVHLILAMPQRAWLSNVVIGGPNLDTLYVTCGDKVFQRKIRQ